MKKKSIHIIFLTVVSMSVSACFNDFVETQYTSDTPGYVSPKTQANKMANRQNNRFINSESKFRKQNAQTVPVILNDPFAAGISNSLQNALNDPFSQNIFQQQQNPNPYGSLANSENGIIRGNVLIQNSAPVYPQSSFGNNTFSPYRR